MTDQPVGYRYIGGDPDWWPWLFNAAWEEAYAAAMAVLEAQCVQAAQLTPEARWAYLAVVWPHDALVSHRPDAAGNWHVVLMTPPSVACLLVPDPSLHFRMANVAPELYELLLGKRGEPNGG